jgi:hypothetical protein
LRVKLKIIKTLTKKIKIKRMRIKTKIKNIYYKLELNGEIINNKTFIK